MKFLLKLLLTALAVFVLQKILPGIEVTSYTYAIWVALVIGILNIFIGPILIFLTLPATLITMGLFLFVINALIIQLAGYFLDGFNVASFWWALLFGVLLSILQPILYSILGEEYTRS